jgi:hypothetical protein
MGRLEVAGSAQKQKGDLHRVCQPNRNEHGVHDSIEPAPQGLELWPEEQLAQDESDEQKGQDAVDGPTLPPGRAPESRCPVVRSGC